MKSFNPAELLKDSGLKVTQTRQDILSLLHTSEKPLSADEVLSKLIRTSKKSVATKKKPDLATIYRNLSTFEDQQIIQSTEMGTGRKLYEWKDSRKHGHHIVCDQCQKIEAIHICGLSEHTKMIEKMGYSNIEHRLVFSGTCSKCQTSRSTTKEVRL